MKLIRIGNDIKIEWTITRYGEPEDFTGKNLSVGLYDKFNEKQTFDYIIDGNVIYGTFYGKDQTTNGVYRLYLTENEGEEDMVTLDYIDCFCISNKLKNQTSNGQDPSSINTEVVQLTSGINIGGTIVQSDWDENDPESPNYIKNKPELFSGDYDDLTNKPTIPTKTSDLTNDSNYVTASNLATVATSGNYNDLTNKPTIPTVPTYVSAFTNDANYVTASNLATVATSGNYNDLTNKPSLFSGNYNDLTNKPTIPTKTSDLTNDSNYVTASSLATVATSGNYNDLSNKPTIPTKTSDLTNDSGFVTLSIFSTVATSGDYNDLINKPTIPVVPTYVSAFTNDANYINQIKTINNQSLIGEGNINIGGGGGVAVQADWAQTDTTADDYIKNKPSLSTVATSGDYDDLTNKPSLFSGNYNDLTNKPTIPTKTSDLTNDSGFVASMSLATVATSGNYNDLTNKPSLFSGNYNDLTNKPTIPTKTSDLTNDSNYITASSLATVATSGNYNDLTNKPSLFSGDYNDLTNKPSLFSGDYNDLTNKPTIPTVPTYVSAFTNDANYVTASSLATVAISGDYSDLSNKPTIPTVPTYVSAFTNDANYVTASSLANCVQSTTTGMRIEVVNEMPASPNPNTLYVVI